jgi:predicted transcriptional regulator
MEPRPQSTSRIGWAASAALVIGVILALAILLDLGPFADEELSEAEFAARGDDICQQAHTDFTKLQESPVRTANEAAALTEELVGISRDELDAIRDLNGPASLEPALERYLEAREKGIAQLRAGLAAAEDGDAFAYADAQAKVASGQADRLKLAQKVGFNECSRVLFGRDQLTQDAEAPLSSDPSAPPTVNNPPTGTP